jgi:hypothetical protein
MLLEDMQANLVGDDAELGEKLQLREWIFEPGLPGNAVRPDPAAFAEVDAAAEAYRSKGTVPVQAWSGWSSAERQRFLKNVPDERSAGQLAALDSALGLSRTGNNEELFLWLELTMQNRYQPAVPQVERFLSTVGRAKFVRPLFTILMEEGDWGEPIAKRIYTKTRPAYHSVTRGAVDEIVTPES